MTLYQIIWTWCQGNMCTISKYHITLWLSFCDDNECQIIESNYLSVQLKLFILHYNIWLVFVPRWTGSNTNPHNNDGQGRAGTDRSNVVLQASQVYPEGESMEWYGKTQKLGHWGRSYPGLLADTSFLGLSATDRMNLALLTNGNNNYFLKELLELFTLFGISVKYQ